MQHQFFDRVYRYYHQHFSELGGKQFHFASRLYLWNADQAYQPKIEELKSWFLAEGFLQREYTTRKQLEAKFPSEILTEIDQKYPQLIHYHDVLLQCLYAQTIYGQDHRAQAEQLVTPEQHQQLLSELLADQRLFATLSTFSICYMFFCYRYLKIAGEVPFDKMKEFGVNQLDSNDPQQLSLQIYYFTHAVIAESLFYARKIPDQYQAAHLEFLKIVEQLISQHFQQCSLDQKFEFLMCAKILEYESELEAQIWQEASASLAPDGDFFIDTLNSYKGVKESTLSGVEHQNVLFLMANQEFLPHSNL